jgi:hypothetical protein
MMAHKIAKRSAQVQTEKKSDEGVTVLQEATRLTAGC